MKLPEKGYYYHYKHTPDSVNNYAYEVLGIGFHTEVLHIENEPLSAEGILVIYRPIYKEAFVYKYGKMFDIRPLEMFMENVTKDGDTIPRFTKINDKEIISELEKIKNEIYFK